MILYSFIISPIEYIIENLFTIFYNVIQFDVLSTIFFISLSVTLFCLPFYSRADKIHKEEEDKLSKIKPYIDKIKRNFKGDEQFFMLQTLYKQHNYSPISALRNTFSLLLQIPFFIAAYHFFSNLDLLNGYSIAFFKDLSKPDSLLKIFGFNINLLPILMTIINIISSEIYIKSLNLKSRIQSYSLAFFFFIILYNSPSGLVLYWTFNNFFYLIKNLFFDNSPKKFFSILFALGLVVFFINFVRYYYPKDNDFSPLITLAAFVILIIVFICVLLFYIYKYLKKELEKQSNLFITVSTDFILKVFFICGFGFVLLQSLIIPANLLTSDLSAFIMDSVFKKNLINVIVYNLLSCAGLFLLWGGITLYFLNNKHRTYFIIIYLSIFLFSLFNYVTFPNSLGIISADLVFENHKAVEENFSNTVVHFINGSILLLFTIILIYAFKKSKLKPIMCVILILFTSVFILSGIYTYRLFSDLNRLEKIQNNENILYEKSNKIELTKSGKNVIIIFLDRFVGALIPVILDEKPEFKNIYSGFIFYPNTISFYRYTILAYPPVVGGYEYTPFVLDEDKRLFSDKWLEACLMLPTLFKNNNYFSTVVDPMGDFDFNMRFDNDVDFAHIYKSKGINYLKMSGLYNSEFYMKNDKKISEDYLKNLKKKLYIYSFFTTSATFCKKLIYDEGSYLLSRPDSVYNATDHQFISSYAALYCLNRVTRLNDSKNTFTLINNELPHRFYFLNYPNYEYSKVVKNIGPRKFEEDSGLMSYHTAMASFILVGKYLDYLKKIGVYDNSRIVIVSDHGNSHTKFPQYSPFININAIPLNPLLMVKDFNQNHSLKFDKTFMTNADVPYIATKDLINDAKNPFTGKTLKSMNKSEGVDVYMNFKYWNAPQFKSNRTILDENPVIKQVKDDIFVESNWKVIDYKRGIK